MREFTRRVLFLMIITSLFCCQACAGDNGDDDDFTLTVQQLRTIAENHGQKINIAVIYSKAGGGHLSAANAIEESLTTEELKDVFNVVKTDPFDHGIMKLCGKDTFEFLSRNNMWGMMRIYQNCQGMSESFMRNFKAEDIRRTVLNAVPNPDVIISVAFTGNGIFKALSDDLHIPFFLVPTDFDAEKFLFYLDGLECNQRFKVMLPSSDPMVLKPCADKRINNPVITGYPTRPSFIKLIDNLRKGETGFPSSIESKRSCFGINPKDNVVVINMGGGGFAEKLVHQYIDIIANNIFDLKHPEADKVHILVVTGRNQALHSALLQKKSMIDNNFITLHPLPFQSSTDMAVLLSPQFTDFMIGKTGGATTGELLVSGLPVVINPDSHTGLSFEKANALFLKQRGQGELLATAERGGRVNQADFITVTRDFFHREKEALSPVENKFSRKLPEELLKSLKN